MIQSCTLLGMLGWCSVEDIRRKKVLIYPILGFGIIGIVMRMYFQNISIYEMLAGVAIGGVLLVLSIWTKQMGTGDALVLMVSGIYLGFWENARLFFHGLFLCGVWSLVLLLIRKKRGKDEIAFMPFLFLAYLEMMLL